ncbi:MAG: hypothetical protein Q9202_004745 [Teloschistes flavicans]
MKYGWSMRGFGPHLNEFSTIGHEQHRIRRAAVAPFFSKMLVQQLEPSVQAMIDKLLSRLDRLKGTGTLINLVDVFPCLTADIICQYAFASPYGCLDAPDFAPTWHRVVMDVSVAFHLFKQFPWIETMIRQIPTGMMKKMVPRMGALILLSEMVREKIDRVQTDLQQGRKMEGQRTIFHDLFTNNQLPPGEKTAERLEAEGVGLVAAGTMTGALTLSVISYNVLAQPAILQKLQKELGEALPRLGPQSKWSQLERLPYLSAVVQEGFRCVPVALERHFWLLRLTASRRAYGVSHRLQRISPDVDLKYKEYSIPRGTPVGMTSVLMHDNPSLFPSPHTFDPERWLQPSSAQLRKYVVPFSKGTRQCLGMNLAYSELYLTLAALFSPFNGLQFELFETSDADAEVVHDFFNPDHAAESRGIRVKVV